MFEHVESRLGEMTSVKTKFQYQSLEDFEFQGRSATVDMLHLMILCLNYIVTFDFEILCQGTLRESASHHIL